MAVAEPGTGDRNRSTLPILFSVIIIDLIAFGIIIPVLPAYAKDLGESALMLGVLLATHAALQFVFAPIWGRLSDRIGRRPVMLFSMFGTSISMVILGLADSFEGLLLARVLSGTFSANISVATAYVADVTHESERTRFMGMVGASFGVGFILGPALGGGLAWLGHGVPMFFAAGLAFINCVWAAFSLVEPQRSEGENQPRSGFIRALRDAMADSVAARLCVTNFFFTLGVTQLESTFFYFMNDRFGYRPESGGLHTGGHGDLDGGNPGRGYPLASHTLRRTFAADHRAGDAGTFLPSGARRRRSDFSHAGPVRIGHRPRHQPTSHDQHHFHANSPEQSRHATGGVPIERGPGPNPGPRGRGPALYVLPRGPLHPGRTSFPAGYLDHAGPSQRKRTERIANSLRRAKHEPLITRLPGDSR